MRGQTHPAVSKAILTGRISEAVRADGKIDVAQADALWPTPEVAFEPARARVPRPPPWKYRAQLLLGALEDPPDGSVERQLRDAIETALASVAVPPDGSVRTGPANQSQEGDGKWIE